MSETQKKKPTPNPKPKSTYTPTQLSEVLAMQRVGNQTPPPPPSSTSTKPGSNRITGKTYSVRTDDHTVSRLIWTGSGWKQTPRPRKGGGGGGGSGKLTPLAPYQPLPFPKLIPKGQYGTDPATYGLRNRVNDGLMEMRKNNNNIQRQKYNRLMMTPQGKYRRQLWDMKMAEVGLNPQGNPLGGLRQIMIQRMNQLRGGR